MKDVIIIGAGGFAKEVICYIQEDIINGTLQDVHLKGILDGFRKELL